MSARGTTKHTPGPWTVERKVEVYGPSRGFGSEPICDCGEGEVVRAECEANANLISAAPDLLEAAMHCLRNHGGFTIAGETERKLRAALSKAEPA